MKYEEKANTDVDSKSDNNNSRHKMIQKRFKLHVCNLILNEMNHSNAMAWDLFMDLTYDSQINILLKHFSEIICMLVY